MSAANSPNHRSNGGFDGSSFYDPDFTVDISNRMRVPDKLSVHDDDHNSRVPPINPKDGNDWMRVPDRILVAGGDKYTAGRTTIPEMKLEPSMMGDPHMQEHVQLMTPPRHLTLNEHEYPSVEVENDLNLFQNEAKSASKKRNRELNFQTPLQEVSGYGQDTPQDAYLNSFYNSNNSVAGLDDVTLVKRQVKSLTRRVTALERDNQQRYQRDVVIYAVGVLYMIMKGFSWLNRRW